MTITALTLTVTLHSDAGDVTQTVRRDGQTAANWVTVMPACQAAWMEAMRRVEEAGG